MPAHFDTDAEDEKLAAIREEEEEDLAKILSEKHNLTYIDLSTVSVNMDALRLIPEEKARAAEAVAFEHTGTKLSIAVHSPNNQNLPELFAELESRGLKLEKFLVSKRSLDKALSRYVDLSYAQMSTAGVFDIAHDDFDTLKAQYTSIRSLKEHLDETLKAKRSGQVSRAFEDIIATALSMKASDIHFEPEEEAVRLRLRLDGMLTDAYAFDAAAFRALLSRIKLLSGLKLNVQNKAQDGRFTIVVQGAPVEVRTSIIPGNYGEAIVLRILDPSILSRSFADMGINEKLFARLAKEIRRPNGMLLTTGPTGSGKTTTLYSFLRELHSPDVKLVTIEDPVEYHLQGIVQTQVDGKNYTFASGLRSILRQDPDVILVGEIRDAEVAQTAVQAALTGHFVFSTLHTNNAAGTFPRLIDLGVDPKLFASAITVAMAQRLVRTLNQDTKKARATTDEEKRMMEKVFSTLTDTSLIPSSFETVYEASPTEEGDTGYKGRIGVHEAIFMDDELGAFLRDNPAEGDIAKHAARQGYLTMAQDGLIKALKGQTTLEELIRAVEFPQ